MLSFENLAAFSQFESDLDAATKARLDRGARIVEMFKQTAFNPIPVEVQTAIMWGMQNDFFDSIDVDKISEAVSSLKDYLSAQGKKVCNEIYQSGKLEESTEQNLRSALEDWKKNICLIADGLLILCRIQETFEIASRALKAHARLLVRCRWLLLPK